MFANGNYATVWGSVTDDKGHVKVELSTSRRNKETGKYETDFSSKYVNFVGSAKELGASLVKGDRVKLGSCGVTSSYNKETQRGYTNYIVFEAEKVDHRNTPSRSGEELAEAVNEDDLPY